MPADIPKLDLASKSIPDEQKENLRQLFPEVFTEDKIDWDQLRRTLGGEVIEEKKERFGLTWPGKADCFRIIQEPSIGTLKPAKGESVDWNTTENLFIEGDNLEVLKLLQKSYYGKVKMIYIDPPYNTGNEFIYPDKFAETLDTYLAYTGQIDAEGKKFSTNTETNGRYHSNWLDMMYPRLFLARNLLRDDGVVFVSIDDHEVHNLREMMNEIFGEENFFAQIIIRSNSRGQTYKQIAKTHEYLIVYTKNPETDLYELEKDEESDDLIYADEIGKFNIRELRNRNPKFGKHNRPRLYYEIYVNPLTPDKDGFFPVSLTKNEVYNNEVLPLNSEGKESCWRWNRKKFNENNDINTLKSNLIAKKKQNGSFGIFEKYRKSTFKPKSIWTIDDYLTERGIVWEDNEYLTERGTVEIRELGLSGIFDFPKPIQIIKTPIALSTIDDDIILDFFSGSCTTAHAVFEINKEDGGKRKFIMVQLPEPTGEDSDASKAGFKTIADIGKERIRRAIMKNKGEQKENTKQKTITSESTEFDGDESEDLGFRVFKLSKSNFKVWDGKIPANGKVEQQIELFIDHIDPHSSEEEILFEILLKSGFPLTTPVAEKKIAKKTIYAVDNDALLICLEHDLTKDLIVKIAELKPARVVCLDAGFKGNDQLRTNAMEIMKSHGVTDFRTV